MTIEMTTAVQARLLGLLTSDGRVWSRTELADGLAEGIALPDFEAGTAAEAIDGLISDGLAHRVSKELVAASQRAMRGDGVDLGEGALRIPEVAGVGVVEPVEAPDHLVGGAEGDLGKLWRGHN